MDLFSRIYHAPQGRDERNLTGRCKRRLSGMAHTIAMRHHNYGALLRTFESMTRGEIGVPLPRVGVAQSIERFFETIPDDKDILDGISLFARALLSSNAGADAPRWLEFVERLFREEGLAYTIQGGVVRYYIDDAFQGHAISAVEALSVPKYNAAARLIKEAIEQLNRLDGSPKTAVQRVFEGVEEAFKTATQHRGNLGAGEIDKVLAPAIDRSSIGDDVAKGGAAQVMQAMRDWVNAAHKYRHAQGGPEPVEPPLDLAVALVGLGVTFARFIGGRFP